MPNMQGLADDRSFLWQAYRFDGLWYSTGITEGTLFITHTGVEAVVEWWLANLPYTDLIETSWGTRTVPARVVANRIAELAAAELGEPPA